MNKQTLELFSGTGSFSKIAREYGYKTLTLDNQPHLNPDVLGDIMSWEPPKGFKPLIIWASPPCTQFSIASVSAYKTYWNIGKEPPDVKYFYKTLELIALLKPKYWFIENPRGMARTLKFMRKVPRYTVSYCQYGFNVMKPTDIWSNIKGFQPKLCKNNRDCHERSPRGSRTGIQGKDNAQDRGEIPPDLIRALLNTIQNDNTLKRYY